MVRILEGFDGCGATGDFVLGHFNPLWWWTLVSLFWTTLAFGLEPERNQVLSSETWG